MEHTSLVQPKGISRGTFVTALVIVTLVAIVFGSVLGAAGGVLGTIYLPVLSQKTGITLPWLASIPSPLAKELDEKNGVIKVEEESATVDVVKRASPSVVSILISKDISKLSGNTGANPFPFDDFFQFGFPSGIPVAPKAPALKPGEKAPVTPPQIQQIGGGSGFIISSDGLILTNRHVVSDDEAEYTVITSDEKEYKAKVLAKDTVNDLALIKIEATGLSPLELGDSSSISNGQTVIAIGYSLGEYKNTVTRGVVSGINRMVQAGDGNGDSELISEAIQTDAAINPGNSGGPLLNLAGQVIGMNTAVNREGQSIGFAIPINVAKKSIDSVKKYGKIVRPWLGVRYVLVNSDIKKKNNLSVDYGALIDGDATKGEMGVVAGSPAQKAGLLDGDIILSLNGTKIDTTHTLVSQISQLSPGDTIKLKVLSKGVEKEVSVTLEEFKEVK